MADARLWDFADDSSRGISRKTRRLASQPRPRQLCCWSLVLMVGLASSEVSRSSSRSSSSRGDLGGHPSFADVSPIELILF